VPGGGQSDQWRQLNFKGKYAGDIRIELTYYDTRPKPESAVDKRKTRDKSNSMVSDATSSLSASRQPGPREIRRRPLPPGPGGYSSPALDQDVQDQWLQDGSDDYMDHKYTNSNPPPRPLKQKFIPETPDDVGYELNPHFGPGPYEPQLPSRGQQLSTYNDPRHDYSDSFPPYEEPDSYDNAYQPRHLSQQPHTPSHSRPTSSSAPHSPYQDPPYHSSPPRMTPQATPPQAQSWNNRMSTSPSKYATYRDSPLRQSVTQHDMSERAPRFPDSRFDDDEPPPPPPTHRNHSARMPVSPATFDEPNVHSPSAAMLYQPSSSQSQRRDDHVIEDQSPLQRLERDYGLVQTEESPRPLQTGRSHESIPAAHDDRYPAFPRDRRKSNVQEMPPLRQAASTGDVQPLHENNYAYDANSRVLRDEFGCPAGHAPPQRAQTFDHFEDERHIRRSDPVIVRPRAISPNPNHNIPRKSITPTFGMPERSTSHSPFGPDSYDALNPGTSPIADEGAYKYPKQDMEAARQKEVDKLRDQGPIIGNDGRVIDPSDHLPSDTWAPEPERKQRKPEHVIKIRTREEARMQRNQGPSPASVRPHSIATLPYPSSPQSSPYPSPHPQAPSSYQSSPSGAPISPQADSPGNRNRLRKPMPLRPLPTQPYPQPQSSPAVPTLPSMDNRPQPTPQRHSVHSSPAGMLPQHPALSEYQVPPASSYSPRGMNERQFDSRRDYGSTPSRMPPDDRAYSGGSPYGGDSPLALELSMIDIGPSRNARTTLRPQRAYGAY
jgi:hypothetical protein